MDGFRPVRVYFWAVLGLVLFGLALVAWGLILAAKTPLTAGFDQASFSGTPNQTLANQAVAQSNSAVVNAHTQESFIEIDQTGHNLDIITDGSLTNWQYFIQTIEPSCNGQTNLSWTSLDAPTAVISLTLPVVRPNISNWYCLRAQTASGDHIYQKYHYQPLVGDLVVAGNQSPTDPIAVDSRPSIWSLLIVIAATISLTLSLRKPLKNS